MPAPATPPPPDEAVLIRLAREAAGLSPERAAALTDGKVGGARWRQIERGHRGDIDKPVIGPDATVAQMARAVGITPERLAEAGRERAAEILAEIQRSEPAAEASGPASDAVSQLPAWQQEVILRVLDERPRSRREKALLLRTLAAKLETETETDDSAGQSVDSSTKQGTAGA
ncbi:hypothetical protein ACIQU5_28160 [Streptomyces sp. NPDC090306]|uniref:hypothetical protein n=1 Tax=Streptomyces sp. NPDC090306 TaxID=3365961 RepID=UPI003825A1D0